MRHRLPYALWLALGLLAAPVPAQDGPTDPPQAPPAAEPPAEPKAEEPPVAEPPPATPDVLDTAWLRQRIEALEAKETAEDFTEQEKARLDAYRKAVAWLVEAGGAATRRQEFERVATDAPAQIEAVQARLAQPSEAKPPEAPADATLAQLQEGLDQATADLEATRKQIAEINDRLDRREKRRPEIRDALSRDQEQLKEIEASLASLPLAEDTPETTLSKRAVLSAEERMLQARIAAVQAEQRAYEAEQPLLPLRRELLVRRVSELEAIQTAWRQLVETARAADIRRQQEEAAEALAEAHPEVAEIAEDNKELAKKRKELLSSIEQAQRELTEIPVDPDELESTLKRLRERVETVGLTPTVGLVLSKTRKELPDTREFRRRIRERQATMADLEFARLDLEDEYRELVDRQERLVQVILEGLPAAVSDTERAAIERQTREQYRRKREYLVSLNDDLTTYFDLLESLNSQEEGLIRVTSAIAGYIDERILWIRSSAPLRWSDRDDVMSAVGWLFSADTWAPVADVLFTKGRVRWVALFVVLAATGALFGLRHRLQRRLRRIAGEVASASTDTFGRTLLAAVLTVLRAGVWPVAMWTVGYIILRADREGQVEMAQVAGTVLTNTALLYFVLQLMHEICQPRGLGEAHFRWRPQNLVVARRNLRWLTAAIVPLALLTGIAQQQDNEAYRASFGRLAFIPAMLCLSLFMQRMLSPKSGVVRDYLNRRRGGWVDRLKYVWYPAAVLLPAMLAFQSYLGFHYTAVHLAVQVVDTGYFLIAMWLVYGLLLRWLLVAQRRLALEEAKRRRLAYEERLAREEDGAGDAAPPVEETTIDVSAVSAQARQLLRGMRTFATLIGLWLIWADALPAFGFLSTIELWGGATALAADGVTEVVTMINLQDLLMALIVLVVTMIIAKNIPGLLEITILQRLPLEHGSRYAITTVLRYTITIVGVVVAFAQIGVTWQKVQFLAAAISVGLGFGLQEIFGNFVSGLIILFERPIRVGDTVTVGQIHGTVSQIRIRSTTVIDWDRKELVIPNKEFVTSTIMNWTLSDPILRLVFTVGIAYGSDTALAEKILLKTADDNPMVLKEPAPTVVFSKFGDSSLEFNLRLFISSIDVLYRVRHDIHNAIDREFRRAKIEIAFPQRDIHVRSVRSTVPVDLETITEQQQQQQT